MYLFSVLVAGAFGITSVVVVISAIVAGNVYRAIKDKKEEKQ